MSEENRPVNRKTLDNLAPLLGLLMENFGGDRQQLEQNLRQPLTIQELPKALGPLASQPPLATYGVDAEGNKHRLFGLQVNGGALEQGDEITELYVAVLLQHPSLQHKQIFVVLFADKDFRAVSFLGNGLNTAADDENKVASDNISAVLEDAGGKLGDTVAQLMGAILLSAANAIPPEDLGPKGRKMQALVNAELGLPGATGDLALSDKMVARVPEILKFISHVYGLEEQALFDLFEPTLRETIKEEEPLTADNLQESALSHEALNDVSLGVGDVDDNGDVHLIALEIPLRDDESNSLDELAVIFTPDNIKVQLTSGNLKIAATPEQGQEPVFKGKEVAQLVRTSKSLSGEQAAANKALVENTLRTFVKSASGRSSKKLQEVLMLLSTLS